MDRSNLLVVMAGLLPCKGASDLVAEAQDFEPGARQLIDNELTQGNPASGSGRAEERSINAMSELLDSRLQKLSS